MEVKAIHEFISHLSRVIWGEYVLIPLLAGVGVYLTIGLYGLPWRRIPYAFRLLWQGRENRADVDGEISPFQALMTALAATIGTGNIAGVATAIYFGGPGAVFWMWVIALFGMATKYSEAVLAVRFRRVDRIGQFVGGPMYYIEEGLGAGWKWLAVSFAVFGTIAAFGIGNMVQSNSVADVLRSSYDIPVWTTGLVIALLAGSVIIGGVRRIAEVASRLVPFMAIAYIVAALTILLLYAEGIPRALVLIVTSAFNDTAATGGFAGATVSMAIQLGFARGIFSNEAGLGSAAIAHAAAKTNDPVRQGLVGMLGTFIDTIIVCSLSAMVIIVTGAWGSGEQGASMSAAAFAAGLGGVGQHIVSIALAIFAFTTIIGWSYYGERCAEFLFGVRIIRLYRILWVAAILAGARFELNTVWALADVFNGLMAIPNLVALVMLSPVVFALTRQFVSNNPDTPEGSTQ